MSQQKIDWNHEWDEARAAVVQNEPAAIWILLEKNFLGRGQKRGAAEKCLK